jgi:hypothetical protein
MPQPIASYMDVLDSKLVFGPDLIPRIGTHIIITFCKADSDVCVVVELEYIQIKGAWCFKKSLRNGDGTVDMMDSVEPIFDGTRLVNWPFAKETKMPFVDFDEVRVKVWPDHPVMVKMFERLGKVFEDRERRGVRSVHTRLWRRLEGDEADEACEQLRQTIRRQVKARKLKIQK